MYKMKTRWAPGSSTPAISLMVWFIKNQMVLMDKYTAASKKDIRNIAV
jgi:hypothetical protein